MEHPDMIEIGQPFKVWRASCSMCPAHTLLVADQPAPTQCAACLAPIATLEQVTATVTD
jgi:hypothetical protein